jgi:hypothetical protein
MPISVELTIPSAHLVGTQVGRALMPMGNEIITQLRRIDENIQYYTDLFRPLPDRLGASVADGMQRLSVRVYETNETMLDHIEAMRWAIAWFAYNLMVDVWWLLNAMYAREGQILAAIRALQGDIASLAAEINAIGACVCGLLQAILDALRAGITLTGSIAITITGGGGGGGIFDFLKDISLWRLLALLAMLAGFVAALGLAMDLFTTNALIAGAAIAMFVAAIIPLLDKLASFDWAQIAKIGVGLAALAGFVAALGYALKPLTKEVAEAIPALNSLIEALGNLAVKLGAMSVGDLLVMSGALTALAGFMYALAKSLAMVSAETLKALGPLREFIDHLGDFAVKLGALSTGSMLVLAGSLAALAGFMYALAKSLSMLSAETLKALGPLSQFIDHLGDFAVKLAALSTGSMLVLAGALAALAGFVYALAKSLSMLSAETLKALGPLSEFIDHLGDFAVKLAALSAGKVIALAAALTALGIFVNSLADSLSKLTAETLKALGPLSEFIDHLGDFAVKLAALSAGQVAALGAALLALGVFVSSLADSLAKLSADTLRALGPFSDFIDSLARLAVTLAALSLGDVAVMGLALFALAEFVSSLAESLSGMSVELLNALPSFTALIGALQSIATALAALSVGELVTMGIAFAMIAGFVWSLAAALVYAEGPLKSLASILENMRGILSDVVNYGGKILDFIEGLGGEAGGGGLLEGILGGLGGAALDLLPELLPLLVSAEPPAPAGPGAAPPGGTMLAAAPTAVPTLVPPAAGPQVDASVNVAGGISVAINADKLEADAAQLLSDQIIAQLQARLGALRSEQDFRLGARPAAAA